VKFLNADKGYGFIVPADGGREVFFHGSTVEDEGFEKLWEGQQVGYELAPSRNASDERGPRALLVRPLRLTQSAAPAEPEGHAPLRRHTRSLAKKPSWRR
jgi:CspA family cold shock protein